MNSCTKSTPNISKISIPIDIRKNTYTVNNKGIENLSNSTTFKEVSKSAVKEFEIPVPSIDSQMKVVKIADDVLLKSKQNQSKLEHQLAYLKQLKSSILSKAFKGEL
jgi:type I restriction enzyme S subunit